MTETRPLKHGRIYGVGDGWQVAVKFLSNPEIDGRQLHVTLLVVDPDDGEQSVGLHVGDRFPIGPETWQVHNIEGLGTYDYVVWIARVDEPTRPASGQAEQNMAPEL